LQATLTPGEQHLFASPLCTTRTAAYLAPGTGGRSLSTIAVAVRDIVFSAAWREGTHEPDFRVKLPVPGLDERILPVKDHFLLRQAELAGTGSDTQIHALTRAVRQMGEQVVVRLGLSRAFQSTAGQEAFCWLMADGFFSLVDPQP